MILKLCADLTNTATVFGAAIELDGEAVQALHPEEKLTDRQYGSGARRTLAGDPA